MRVALLGAGNVTRAFLAYWNERDFGIDLRIVSVLRTRGVWHGEADAGLNLDSLEYRPNLDPVGEAQFVIEALPSRYPDGEPATSLLERALDRGIDVLTVDKGPLVAAYRHLADIAARTGAKFRFCVGGALPTVDLALRDLRGSTIRSMRGILNGTTNFILSEMHARSCTLDDALRIAVERGIAEPDPSQDLDGIDTAAKMLILANAALHLDIRMDQVRIQGIRDVDPLEALRQNRVWKLVGACENGAIRVQPELLPLSDVFAHVNGTAKILEFDSVELGRLAAFGGASGRTQMAAAITKEILNMYR